MANIILPDPNTNVTIDQSRRVIVLNPEERVLVLPGGDSEETVAPTVDGRVQLDPADSLDYLTNKLGNEFSSTGSVFNLNRDPATLDLDGNNLRVISVYSGGAASGHVLTSNGDGTSTFQLFDLSAYSTTTQLNTAGHLTNVAYTNANANFTELLQVDGMEVYHPGNANRTDVNWTANSLISNSGATIGGNINMAGDLTKSSNNATFNIRTTGTGDYAIGFGSGSGGLFYYGGTTTIQFHVNQQGVTNTRSDYHINGVSINTAGTLDNVAYKNINNNFTQSQSITGNISTTGTASFGNNVTITSGDPNFSLVDTSSPGYTFRMQKVSSTQRFFSSDGNNVGSGGYVFYGATTSTNIGDFFVRHSGANRQIYHAGVANLSTVNWTSRDLTSFGTLTVRSNAPTFIMRDEDNVGDGTYYRMIASGGNMNWQSSPDNNAINYQTFLRKNANGSVELRHSGVTRISTAATGGTVAGTWDCDDLIISGASPVVGRVWTCTSGTGTGSWQAIPTPAAPTLQTVTEAGATSDQFLTLTGGIRTTGSTSERFGFNALNNSVSGNNTAFGWRTLEANNGGVNCVAVGSESMRANLTARECVAVGTRTLRNVTAGGNILAIGDSALNMATNVSSMVAVGASALRTNLTGRWCVAIGDLAGEFQLGSSCTFIGNRAGRGQSSGETFTNSTAIGANATITANNQMVLGSGVTEIRTTATFRSTNASPLASAPNNVNATSGHVLTANGSGGSSWQPVSADPASVGTLQQVTSQGATSNVATTFSGGLTSNTLSLTGLSHNNGQILSIGSGGVISAIDAPSVVVPTLHQVVGQGDTTSLPVNLNGGVTSTGNVTSSTLTLTGLSHTDGQLLSIGSGGVISAVNVPATPTIQAVSDAGATTTTLLNLNGGVTSTSRITSADLTLTGLSHTDGQLLSIGSGGVISAVNVPATPTIQAVSDAGATTTTLVNLNGGIATTGNTTTSTLTITGLSNTNGQLLSIATNGTISAVDDIIHTLQQISDQGATTTTLLNLNGGVTSTSRITSADLTLTGLSHTNGQFLSIGSGGVISAVNAPTFTVPTLQQVTNAGATTTIASTFTAGLTSNGRITTSALSVTGLNHVNGQLLSVGQDGVITAVNAPSFTTPTLQEVSNQGAETTTQLVLRGGVTVVGTTATTNLRITNGAAANRVWTCTNSFGLGSWQDLPGTPTLQEVTTAGATTNVTSTFNNGIHVVNGIRSDHNGNNDNGGNIVLGQTTVNTTKFTSITSRQFDNATETEGFTILSTVAGTLGNSIMIGGGFTQQNAATTTDIYAGAGTSTRTGTRVARFETSGITATTLVTSPNLTLTGLGHTNGQLLSIGAGGVISAVSVQGVNVLTETFTISNWNMLNTGLISRGITFNVSPHNIRRISVIIVDDDGLSAEDLLDAGSFRYNRNNLVLERDGAGKFQSGSYESTTAIRAYVTIDYTVTP